MDSAAIPSLPPQWWRWQQAASPLPPMVAAAGTLPQVNLDPVLMTPQGACGGVQSMAVMRSMASCPLSRSLRVTGELYIDELQVLTSLYFSQAAKRCCTKSTCCKCIFQMFQMFQNCVAIVSCRCCKSRARCCICCNSCTCIL